MPPISGNQKAPLKALMGVARIGATRLGYVSSQAFVRVNGSIVSGLIDDISVTETLGAPSTGQMAMMGPPPDEGHEVIITLGSINAGTPRFAGVVLRTDQDYQHEPGYVSHRVSLIDYTWGLNGLKVSGHFTGTGTTIFRELIATYAPGYTANVAEDLPTVDGGITFTFQDLLSAIKQLGDRIGAVMRCDYTRTVHFFIPPETGRTPPQEVNASNPTLLVDPPVDVSRDLSPMISRVFHEGGGSNVLTTVAIGETILPVADASWYEELGGVVVSGPQRITYTGVQLGGAGSLVGPSVTPIVKPYTTLSEGGSLTAGAHQWAYTWVTGAGETLPSPLSVVQTARNYTPPTPGVAPTAYPVPSVDAHATYNYYADTSGLTIGESYTYRLAFITGSGAGVSDLGPESAAVTAVASLNNPAIPSQIIIRFDVPGNGHPADGALIRQVLVYRIENGSGVTELTGWVTIGEHDVYLTEMVAFDIGGGEGSEYGSGGLYGPASAAAFFTVDLYGIATGPAGTTQRKIYQTATGGSQLKLQQTLANNTAYTATASAADGSLGANAPTTDTSGLSTVAGRVNAGSTSVETPSTGPFPTTGGWAISGQQVIRYTSISGNYLFGIPETGVGAIVTPLNYGDPLTPAPALTGISRIWTFHPAIVSIVATVSPDIIEFTVDSEHDLAVGDPFVIAGAEFKGFNQTHVVSAVPGLFTFRAVNEVGVSSEGAGAVLAEPAFIRYTIPQGQDVNLLAQIDDFEAQAELAARLSTATFTHSGIIEDYLQDRRLSYAEAYARGEAHLLERNQVNVAIAYQTRDLNSHAGLIAPVDLAAPTNVAGDFVIQSATTTYGTSGTPVPPVTAVKGADAVFSFADLVRLDS